jgi:hypothetical protein
MTIGEVIGLYGEGPERRARVRSTYLAVDAHAGFERQWLSLYTSVSASVTRK